MRKQIRQLNDETGVTLVELLAAITILSIIVTAFLGFFIQAAKTNQHTNQVNEATFLAQEQMEKIIHNAPSRPDDLQPDHEDYIITIKIGDEPIDEVDLTEERGLYSVRVIISDKGDKVRAKMENILPLNAK